MFADWESNSSPAITDRRYSAATPRHRNVVYSLRENPRSVMHCVLRIRYNRSQGPGVARRSLQGAFPGVQSAMGRRLIHGSHTRQTAACMRHPRTYATQRW